jgi:glycosyltransferase involved in cell wall biosynthesis
MTTEITASSVFVIIPAFNEAKVIASTVAPLLAAGYRVVVVDDHSADQTWAVLETLPLVRIRHRINLGQGAALETGMEYARRQGAQIVVHFDADGQHNPAEIGELVSPILSGRADIVFGSRFLRADDSLQVPRLKRALLRAGRVFSGLMTGVWLSDTHNGFRALSGKALAAIRLQENGFAHATEILDAAGRASLHYVEVPVNIRYTAYSRAKGQPMSNAINIVVDLIIHKIFR